MESCSECHATSSTTLVWPMKMALASSVFCSLGTPLISHRQIVLEKKKKKNTNADYYQLPAYYHYTHMFRHQLALQLPSTMLFRYIMILLYYYTSVGLAQTQHGYQDSTFKKTIHTLCILFHVVTHLWSTVYIVHVRRKKQCIMSYS